MIKYAIIFTILGFLLSKFIEDEKMVFIAFVVISFLWGLTSASIWGLVTFGELAFGYAISRVVKGRT
tara:strand:- start:173 stop:373 length:201 start_codon:yes stop_codon:yes gene_type:complete